MREYISHTEPIPFIIIKNCFPEKEVELMLGECDRLSHLLQYQAPVRSNDPVQKHNTQAGVDEQYVNRTVSPILKSMDSIYDDVKLQEKLKALHWFYKSWFCTNNDGTFLSYSKKGDYYKGHQDIAVISWLYWLWNEPKPFKGGDLILPNYDIKIPVERNQLMIFPSSIMHEVEPITDGYGRWTIARFLWLKSFGSTHQEAGGDWIEKKT